MSDEEKVELDNLLKNLLQLLRLTVPKIDNHAQKLEAGTERMHSIELSMKDLPCGQNQQRLETLEKKNDDDKRFRNSLVIFGMGVVLSIMGVAVGWGSLNKRVDNIEKFVDKFDIVITQKK